MTEKKGKFELPLRPSRTNYIGAVLSVVGFLLTLLCLVGSRHPSGKGLHFVKLTDNPPGPLALYISWQGYCVDDQGRTDCKTDDGVMQAPFDVVIATMFNETYPQLFTDEVELDQDLYPLAAPNPVHNPKVFAASVLCLLCSGAALVIGLLVIVMGYRFPDTHYSRGFFAWAAAVLALLLIAQSCVLYQNGAQMLNLTYPHLIASLGPGLPMIGVAFACFVLAGFAYLHGCFNKDEAIEGGYSAL